VSNSGRGVWIVGTAKDSKVGIEGAMPYKAKGGG
jgi:hypothetical protein